MLQHSRPGEKRQGAEKRQNYAEERRTRITVRGQASRKRAGSPLLLPIFSVYSVYSVVQTCAFRPNAYHFARTNSGRAKTEPRRTRSTRRKATSLLCERQACFASDKPALRAASLLCERQACFASDKLALQATSLLCERQACFASCSSRTSAFSWQGSHPDTALAAACHGNRLNNNKTSFPRKRGFQQRSWSSILIFRLPLSRE
jgi:hypothetical protein